MRRFLRFFLPGLFYGGFYLHIVGLGLFQKQLARAGSQQLGVLTRKGNGAVQLFLSRLILSVQRQRHQQRLVLELAGKVHLCRNARHHGDAIDTACSGSSEEIKIGAGVLDYISELGNIQAKILEAYTYSEQCVQNIESEDTYQGEAREEMLAFFKSLASNMQKMTFLYQAAGTYIQNAYNTMYYNEQQVVEWVIGQIGGNE